MLTEPALTSSHTRTRSLGSDAGTQRVPSCNNGRGGHPFTPAVPPIAGGPGTAGHSSRDGRVLCQVTCAKLRWADRPGAAEDSKSKIGERSGLAGAERRTTTQVVLQQVEEASAMHGRVHPRPQLSQVHPKLQSVSGDEQGSKEARVAEGKRIPIAGGAHRAASDQPSRRGRRSSSIDRS